MMRTYKYSRGKKIHEMCNVHFMNETHLGPGFGNYKKKKKKIHNNNIMTYT